MNAILRFPEPPGVGSPFDAARESITEFHPRAPWFPLDHGCGDAAVYSLIRASQFLMSPRPLPRVALRLLVTVFLLVATDRAAAGPLPGPYGARIASRASSPIPFRRFEPAFLGERHVASSSTKVHP